MLNGNTMVIKISGSNNVVYRNDTSGMRPITIVASGEARVEVKPRTGSAIHRQSFESHGGALSLDVPVGHHVKIDVDGTEAISIEFLSEKPSAD